jgi:hypothetical protein
MALATRSVFDWQASPDEPAIDAPTLRSRCRSWRPVTRERREGLGLDRAHAFSRNRTRLHRSERHLPESASSQKHEHDPQTSEPRAWPRLFSVDTPLQSRSCEPQGTRKNRAGASGAPALRAGGTIQSACARWRLGPLKSAERSLVATRVHASAGDAPTLAEQPRLDSNRLARTSRLSTSRKRPG